VVASAAVHARAVHVEVGVRSFARRRQAGAEGVEFIRDIVKVASAIVVVKPARLAGTARTMLGLPDAPPLVPLRLRPLEPLAKVSVPLDERTDARTVNLVRMPMLGTVSSLLPFSKPLAKVGDLLFEWMAHLPPSWSSRRAW